ncbi:hypothetical protein ACIQWL_22920 [Streptomyces mirabilis]|uniref:hypothetical protein n=1 Tax=Streptomyces mirabilis TaxID=68239 RepID=UPI0033EF9816
MPPRLVSVLVTPRTIVTSSPIAATAAITFFAPPSTCARAHAASVRTPVDSAGGAASRPE